MWPFPKKPRKNFAESANFNDTWSGLAYMPTWERKPLPDPGAQNYAYETYQAAPFTLIGAGVHTMGHPRPMGSPPLVSRAGVIPKGIPLIAGQIFGQPLLNPAATSQPPTAQGQ